MAQTQQFPAENPEEQPKTPTQPANVGRAVARNTLIVMFAFVLSRILGLVRDILIAFTFGTGNGLGEYNAAFRIPDTIFLLVIGGVVGSAFIPVFSGLRQNDDAASWRLTSTMINSSLIIVALAGLVAALFAPALVGSIIAPAFNKEQQQTTVNLTRIMLLSPLFMGLGGWAQGVLNAENRFTLSAFAPIFYNLGIIFGALFLAPPFGIYGLAWGVVVGSALHFISQVPGLLRVGMHYSLRLNLRDTGVTAVFRLIGPRLIGQLAFQANFILITALASGFGPEKVAAINYAYGLMMLPYGVFALSLSTVIFPTLTAQFARDELAQMRRTLWAGVRVLVFLAAASAAGLFALRYQIIELLYAHGGKFTPESTEIVAQALLWFSLGLVAYCVVEVLTRTFYAMQDTRTPVIVAVAAVLLNAALAWPLSAILGHGGLALSLTISTTGELIILLILLHRRFANAADARAEERATLISALKSIIAALVMGGALLGLIRLINLRSAGTLLELLLVTGSIILGAAIFLAVATILRSREVSEALRLMRRPRALPNIRRPLTVIW